jgi:hypothetical protein
VNLTFDADAHVYRLDGKVVPSVTQILAPLVDYSGIPADVLETARIRGQWVHDAVNRHCRGVLDPATLGADVRPYFDQFLLFLSDSAFVPTASEVRVASPKYGYAGTVDLVGEFLNGETLLDVKATADLPAAVGPQTAGYAQAFAETFGRQLKRRSCLHLFPDRYRVEPLTDPVDWPTFLSCLNVARWRARHAA